MNRGQYYIDLFMRQISDENVPDRTLKTKTILFVVIVYNGKLDRNSDYYWLVIHRALFGGKPTSTHWSGTLTSRPFAWYNFMRRFFAVSKVQFPFSLNFISSSAFRFVPATVASVSEKEIFHKKVTFHVLFLSRCFNQPAVNSPGCSCILQSALGAVFGFSPHFSIRPS